MKRKLNILIVGIVVLLMLGSCAENNISFAEQISTAKGFYIIGAASEFSHEVPKGRLHNIEDSTLFSLNGSEFIGKTLSQGNLRLFATSMFNQRSWDSMEFNIYQGQIRYRGVDSKELEKVPVATNIPIELNMKNGTGRFDYVISSEKVPLSATDLYLTGDDFGNMNWVSDLVEKFDRSYSEDYRWFYVNHSTFASISY